jgi:hypothetical protein
MDDMQNVALVIIAAAVASIIVILARTKFGDEENLTPGQRGQVRQIIQEELDQLTAPRPVQPIAEPPKETYVPQPESERIPESVTATDGILNANGGNVPPVTSAPTVTTSVGSGNSATLTGGGTAEVTTYVEGSGTAHPRRRDAKGHYIKGG